jgi:hypothetical protein
MLGVLALEVGGTSHRGCGIEVELGLAQVVPAHLVGLGVLGLLARLRRAVVGAAGTLVGDHRPLLREIRGLLVVDHDPIVLCCPHEINWPPPRTMAVSCV